MELTNDMIFGSGIARETSAFNDLTMINMITDAVLKLSDIEVYNFYPGIDLNFSELKLVEFNKLDYRPRDDSFVYGAQLWWNEHLIGDMIYYHTGTGTNSKHQFVYSDDRYASSQVVDECSLYLIDEFKEYFDEKARVLFNADVSYTTNRGEDMLELIQDGILQFSTIPCYDNLSGIVFDELTMVGYDEVLNDDSGLLDYAVKLMWNDIVITDFICIKSKTGGSLFFYDFLVDANIVNHEFVNDCVRYICREVENQRNARL